MRPIFILHVIGMNVVGDIMYVTWSMSERSLMNKNQMNIRWEQDTRDFEEYWKWPTTWCIWSSPSNLKFYHRKYMLTKKWIKIYQVDQSGRQAETQKREFNQPNISNMCQRSTKYISTKNICLGRQAATQKRKFKQRRKKFNKLQQY